MTDKMREEFEAWIDRQGYFWLADKDAYWEAWKASRAALCVELPDGYIGHPYRNDILSAIDECRIALDDAGVRYK